jgi:hypothetical protein
MAFPTSPTNGQTYTSGGKIYTYNSTKGVWAVTSNVPFLIGDLNAVSAAVNVVSTAISNEISVRTAASAALETHANAVSAAVVVASALATTADNHANTVSIATAAEIADRVSAVALKADIASPTFTGTVTAATVTLSGELRGPASFTIDPAAVGDNTGVVIVKGDLQVDGTTTTVNSTTMSVADKNIVLASGAANAAAASGAGLTVNGPATPATFTYVDTDDSWNLNKKLLVTGTLSATGATTLSGNVGIGGTEVRLTNNAGGQIIGYTGAAYRSITYDALSHIFQSSGASVATVSSTGLAVTGTLSATGAISGAAGSFTTVSASGGITSTGNGDTNAVRLTSATVRPGGFQIVDTDDSESMRVYLSPNSGNGRMAFAIGTGVDPTTVAERMAILTSNGNVGIGTTNPASALHVIYPFVRTDTATRLVATLSSNEASGFHQLYIQGIGAAAQANRAFSFQTSQSGTGDGGYILLQPNAGFVGIGITNPTAHLDISTSDVADTIGIRRSSNSTNGMLKFTTAGTDDWILGERNDATSNFRLYSHGTSSDVLTVLRSNGNVGIGTTSPTFALDVKPGTASTVIRAGSYAIMENVTTDQAMFGRNVQYNSSASGWTYMNNGYATAIRMYDDPGDGSIAFHTAVSGTAGGTPAGWDSTAVKMVIRNGGNVGIGTSSPGYKLDVNGTLGVTGATVYAGSAVMTIGDATRTSSSSTTTGAIVCGGGLGVWADVNAGGSGNFSNTVSVFTQNPSNTAQGVLFRNLYNTGAHLFSQGAATTNGYINWVNGNGTVGSIAATGSGVAYNTSSDYRLKNTVSPMTGALDKVALLKPVTYKWNVDGSDGQGFIAHELAEVEPNCVTGEKDATHEEEYEVTPFIPAVIDAEGVEVTPAVEAVKGTRTVPSYQGVDTSFLVATLTAAIQELKAIIDTQATRIAVLEAK